MDETLLISGFREYREAYLKANVTFALTSLGSVMQGRARLNIIKMTSANPPSSFAAKVFCASSFAFSNEFESQTLRHKKTTLGEGG